MGVDFGVFGCSDFKFSIGMLKRAKLSMNFLNVVALTRVLKTLCFSTTMTLCNVKGAAATTVLLMHKRNESGRKRWPSVNAEKNQRDLTLTLSLSFRSRTRFNLKGSAYQFKADSREENEKKKNRYPRGYRGRSFCDWATIPIVATTLKGIINAIWPRCFNADEDGKLEKKHERVSSRNSAESMKLSHSQNRKVKYLTPWPISDRYK